jgi:hypothetical protein
MIKVGNILIDPNDISSIHLDMKATPPTADRERGFQIIQIIYKNGVVKNFSSAEIGMSYSAFIDAFMKIKEKEETDRIFRMMAAIKSATNV